MIIVKPVGGLASQLHKYAVGKALSVYHDVPLKLDLSWFKNRPSEDTSWDFSLPKLQVPIEIATEAEIKALKPHEQLLKMSRRSRHYLGISIKFKTYSTKSFLSLDEFYALSPNVYIEGEFAGYKYFSSIKGWLQNHIVQPRGTDHQLDRYIDEIDNSLLPVIGVHIRRGDYITNAKARAFHRLCSLKYFELAIKRCEEKFGACNLLVFSDDMNWVKSNFYKKPNSSIKFVENLDTLQQFRLLSQCDHNVISNSGFSWFASWLNTKNNHIFAPPIWVTNPVVNASITDAIRAPNLTFVNE